MERSVFLQGALVAAGVALGGSEYRDLGLLGAGIGAQLTNQKFSRDDESEADHYGIRYMARAGYDPAEAVRLQETFVRLSEGNNPDWLSGLFASHPPSRDRVEANRRQVAALGNPGGEIGREVYQRKIARLKRTKPAYEAYDEAQALFKKDQLGAALRKVNEAIRIEPDEAAFFGLRGEIKAAQKNPDAASEDLDRAVALNPDYYRPLLMRGLLRREAGDGRGAQRDLERSLALLPTAEGYYGLGKAAVAQGRRDQALGYYRKAAGSRSEAGRAAQLALAELDLEQNPSRYLSARVGLTRDGYLVVRVSNPTQVAVGAVEVVVGPRIGNGIRQQARVRVPRVLAAGQDVELRTGLGPMNTTTARGYGAAVATARIAR
jgi:predicted Zn-dependent protease